MSNDAAKFGNLHQLLPGYVAPALWAVLTSFSRRTAASADVVWARCGFAEVNVFVSSALRSSLLRQPCGRSPFARRLSEV